MKQTFVVVFVLAGLILADYFIRSTLIDDYMPIWEMEGKSIPFVLIGSAVLLLIRFLVSKELEDDNQ